jgi:hypothetical protein
VDYNIRGAWFIHLTDADFGKAMPCSNKSQTNGLQHTINRGTSLYAGRTKLKGWDGEKPAIIIT